MMTEHPETPAGNPYAPRPLVSEEDRAAMIENLSRWLELQDAEILGLPDALPVLHRDPAAGVRITVPIAGRPNAVVLLPRGRRFGADEIWPWRWELAGEVLGEIPLDPEPRP